MESLPAISGCALTSRDDAVPIGHTGRTRAWDSVPGVFLVRIHLGRAATSPGFRMGGWVSVMTLHGKI